MRDRGRRNNEGAGKGRDDQKVWDGRKGQEAGTGVDYQRTREGMDDQEMSEKGEG